MTDEFKPGDIVFLKSGSPPLTVEHVGERVVMTVDVSWFDDCGDFHRESFIPIVLTHNSPLLGQLMLDTDLRDIPHGGSA